MLAAESEAEMSPGDICAGELTGCDEPVSRMYLYLASPPLKKWIKIGWRVTEYMLPTNNKGRWNAS